VASKGLLVVISSPSGGGKSTVIRHILRQGHPNHRYSISATTRAKRPNETDGVDYWFVDAAQFDTMIAAGDLVEYEEVHGHLYGTPVKPLEKWLGEGCIVFFDIDVKGAFSIKQRFPEDTVMIFIAPPDFATLKKRLIGRGTEASDDVRIRLGRVPMEMEQGKLFDYQVVNQDLDKTILEVNTIIAGRLRQA
jgi:guanylate kinase